MRQINNTGCNNRKIVQVKKSHSNYEERDFNLHLNNDPAIFVTKI